MEGDRIVSWTYQSDYLLQSILWNPLWVSKVVSCDSHDWLNGNSLATPGIATCHITSCHCTTSRHVNRGRLVACRWMTLWVAVRNVVHWRVWGRIRFNGSSANDRFLLRKVRGGGCHCLPNECTASSKKFYFCRRQNGAVRSLREPPARTRRASRGKESWREKTWEWIGGKKSAPYVENASQTDTESKMSPFLWTFSFERRFIAKTSRVRKVTPRQYPCFDNNSAILISWTRKCEILFEKNSFFFFFWRFLFKFFEISKKLLNTVRV